MFSEGQMSLIDDGVTVALREALHTGSMFAGIARLRAVLSVEHPHRTANASDIIAVLAHEEDILVTTYNELIHDLTRQRLSISLNELDRKVRTVRAARVGLLKTIRTSVKPWMPQAFE
eukprot:Rmarinus@m.30003